MILTIDIGNSNICFGVYEGKMPSLPPAPRRIPCVPKRNTPSFSRRSSVCISPIRPSLPARPSPRSYRRSPPYSTMPSASSAMAISPPLWLAPGSKPALISVSMNPLPGRGPGLYRCGRGGKIPPASHHHRFGHRYQNHRRHRGPQLYRRRYPPWRQDLAGGAFRVGLAAALHRSRYR